MRNTTTYSHFDNGWVKSSTDPWDIATTYDYNPLGQQTSRTVTSAGGSSSRAMSWSYFPDGKVSARTDDGVPVGRQVVLVDNSDLHNVAVAGTWPTASSGSGFLGTDYRTHAAGSGAATFTWKLQVPQSGTYEVFTRHPSGGTATNAPFKVEHSGGSTTKAVNQTQQAGTWVSLGSFSFTEGDGGAGRQVTLSDNAGGTVVADAVKLVRDNSADADNERKTLTYRYDPNGNPATRNHDDEHATYTYDVRDRIRQVTKSAAGGGGLETESYTHDVNNNVITQTVEGATTNFTYGRNRLQKATTGAATAAYNYDPFGRLDKVTSGTTVLERYVYDGFDRVTEHRKNDGTGTDTTRYAYDPLDRTTSRTAKVGAAGEKRTDLNYLGCRARC